MSDRVKKAWSIISVVAAVLAAVAAGAWAAAEKYQALQEQDRVHTRAIQQQHEATIRLSDRVGRVEQDMSRIERAVVRTDANVDWLRRRAEREDRP